MVQINCNLFVTYGITRAPRSAMASPVALDPLSLGINSPLITSFAGGFTMLISTKKHAAMTNTSSATKNSSFRIYSSVRKEHTFMPSASWVYMSIRRSHFRVKLVTPYFCRPRRSSVLEPAIRTPIHTGMWNRRLKANAVPITAERRM